MSTPSTIKFAAPPKAAPAMQPGLELLPTIRAKLIERGKLAAEEVADNV